MIVTQQAHKTTLCFCPTATHLHTFIYYTFTPSHITSKNTLNNTVEIRNNRQKESEFEVKITATKSHIKCDLKNASAKKRHPYGNI